MATAATAAGARPSRRPLGNEIGIADPTPAATTKTTAEATVNSGDAAPTMKARGPHRPETMSQIPIGFSGRRVRAISPEMTETRAEPASANRPAMPGSGIAPWCVGPATYSHQPSMKTVADDKAVRSRTPATARRRRFVTGPLRVPGAPVQPAPRLPGRSAPPCR